MTGLIDHATTNGMKPHKAATAEFGDKCDLERDNLPTFLEHLETSAHEEGWDTTILIMEKCGIAKEDAINAHVKKHAHKETGKPRTLSTCFQQSKPHSHQRHTRSSWHAKMDA